MKTILLNPFEKYGENKLLIIGAIITIAGSFIGLYFNARFDGVLDLHFVQEVGLLDILQDNLINILSLSFLLSLVGKIINNKLRIIDILTTAIIARTPYYILPFFNFNNSIYEAGKNIQSLVEINDMDQLMNSGMVLISLFGLCSLLILIWYIGLLYNGFKVAANAKGTKSIALFSFAIILAEIVSKTIINYIN